MSSVDTKISEAEAVFIERWNKEYREKEIQQFSKRDHTNYDIWPALTHIKTGFILLRQEVGIKEATKYFETVLNFLKEEV